MILQDHCIILQNATGYRSSESRGRYGFAKSSAGSVRGTARTGQRKDFNAPLRVENIAQALGMSVSGLYHQFKAVTTMSPLQFQKQLRLQEARRLMLGEHLDAASAGSRVGYNDAAHFNREYKSLFGLPPMRDVERLRQAASTSTHQEAARGQ
jgi:AraC-like DNA-binding protein